MTSRRRKKLIRTIEGLAVVVVLLNLALYFGVVRTYADRARADEQSFQALRLQVKANEARVARLEKYQADLPEAQKDITLFVQNHVPGRQKAYSQTTDLIREMAAKSGVQLLGVNYKLERAQGEPFDHLGLGVDVAGSFAQLMDFAHALETTNDLIVIRDFALAQQQGGNIELRISLSLYLTP